MNEGKRFEEDFRKSIPDDVYYYRLRDGTASWGGENTRFQASNACDSLLWRDNMLYMIELKSHKGKSIPHNAFRENQINELSNALAYGVTAGFLINMRDVDTTVWVPADMVREHINTSDRKSISLNELLNGYKVKQEKKRTRWRYDINDMLKAVRIDR